MDRSYKKMRTEKRNVLGSFPAGSALIYRIELYERIFYHATHVAAEHIIATSSRISTVSVFIINRDFRVLFYIFRIFKSRARKFRRHNNSTALYVPPGDSTCQDSFLPPHTVETSAQRTCVSAMGRKTRAFVC